MLEGYPFIFQMNDRSYSDELLEYTCSIDLSRRNLTILISCGSNVIRNIRIV